MPRVRVSGVAFRQQPPARRDAELIVNDDEAVDEADGGGSTVASEVGRARSTAATRSAESVAAPRKRKGRAVPASSQKSIVEGMTYGEVRISLNQIWRTRWVVKPQYMLQNGMTVGEFSMKYVIALLQQRKHKVARPAARL